MKIISNRKVLLIAAGVLVVLTIVSYLLAKYLAPSFASPNVMWVDFWVVFSNLVLFFTLLIVSYYTYETYQQRLASVATYELGFRPILVFKASDPNFTVVNKGTGPALNVSLIVWDTKKLKVTDDRSVPGVIPVGESCLFNQHIDIDSTGLNIKLPDYESLFKRITNTKHTLLCLTYRDLVGGLHYSITNGTGANYDKTFEIGCIEKP